MMEEAVNYWLAELGAERLVSLYGRDELIADLIREDGYESLYATMVNEHTHIVLDDVDEAAPVMATLAASGLRFRVDPVFGRLDICVFATRSDVNAVLAGAL
jgi:hypothetical protein